MGSARALPETSCSWRRGSPLQAVGGLAVLLALAGCASPPEVETLTPTRGDLQVSFTEQARTRLSRTWLVPMPVDGRLSRVAVEEGDPVRAGQVLATVDRIPLSTRVAAGTSRVEELQARLRASQDLGVEAAQAAEARARLESERQDRAAQATEVARAEARLAQEERELARQQQLFDAGYVSRQVLEEARLRQTTARQAVLEARARLRAQEASQEAAARQVETATRTGERRLQEAEALQGQLRSARAELRGTSHEAEQARVEAPVAGLVLKRFEAGPGFFPAGTRLLEIGRREDLEAVAEVLTQDALALHPGMPVLLQARDGDAPFQGSVRSLDPAGFTKPSTLGVEQQRVLVRLRLEKPPADLGIGYRVAATFVTRTRHDVLQVPRFSLMQEADGGWSVMAIESGVLRRRPVRTGLLGDQQVEVLEGVREGETLVALPDTTLQDGQRVRPVAPGKR